MIYTPYYTNKIKRQLKTLKKRGYDMNLFKEVVEMLIDGKPLPRKYDDHPLRGDKRGYRDCHIKGDWVLIYKIDKEVLTLILSETGTHSDIMG
ncbi:MAG: type II toxin-antitoxin system YafQ family toxin [Lachnospiraceae bacterium]|jgi:mRNA interferase YafQ|nr:type II toxin-antitoxin system YafQ family toxin [Lachnospiraceae bacterium]